MNQSKLELSIMIIGSILLAVGLIATGPQFIKAQSESANTNNEIKSIISTSNPVLNITSVPNYYTGMSYTFTDPTTIPPSESAPFKLSVSLSDVSNLESIKSYKPMVSSR
jgi:hypothetical protein